MATSHHTIAELRKLETPELLKEVAEKRTNAMKLRLGLEAGSEKDSSKHRRIKKEIARTLTALNEKRRQPKADQLKTSVKDSTVSAPKKSVTKKSKKS